MKKSALAVLTVAAAFGAGGAASAFAAGPGTSAAKPDWQSKAIARIQSAEKSGKLSTARGDALIARVQSGKHVHLGRGGLVRAAAGFVGQTPQQVRAELRSGMSLAQVIGDAGKVSQFEQMLVTKLTDRLNQSTTIDAARKQSIITKLPSRVDRLVNHVWKAPAK